MLTRAVKIPNKQRDTTLNKNKVHKVKLTNATFYSVVDVSITCQSAIAIKQYAFISEI